jgi:hypothetical protein
MPLRVHIRSADAIRGFEPGFTEILKSAFQEWVSASEGNVNIRFIDQPSDADIECLWSSDPSQLQNRAEGGEAQVYFQKNDLIRATIIILTVPINQMNPCHRQTDKICGAP